MVMSELFKTKVRSIGTSLGVIIPMEVIKEEGISLGQEIAVGVLKKRKEFIKSLRGIDKGTKSFVRDRIDRLERRKHAA
tara:strand:+ start:204 stop:440 length:237 start_codon:yes stop_codon:yes gene_type:complete